MEALEVNEKWALNREVTNITKGFAICFVIAGHILGGQFGLISGHVTNLLGTCGVNIFLFLSGFTSVMDSFNVMIIQSGESVKMAGDTLIMCAYQRWTNSLLF